MAKPATISESKYELTIDGLAQGLSRVALYVPAAGSYAL